jgi:hypothetical protein
MGLDLPIGNLPVVGNVLQEIGREDAALGFDADEVVSGYCLHKSNPIQPRTPMRAFRGYE